MRSIVLALFVCSATSLFGQTPYLERRITLSLDKESVERSLQKVSAAGGFVFSYNPDILDQRKVVTYNFVNRSVREILDEIFQGTVQYKARGKYIILTAAPKTSSRNDPAVVSGYVVDESTGERLKDVSIYDPVTLTSAVTDSYGYFEIKIDKPPSEIILSVNRQHYIDTVVAVPGHGRLLNVPIRVNKEKIAVIADSVNQKLRRFWERQEAWFNNINLRNIDHSLYRTFQVSLVPFVGTNHKMSGHVINDYSLNVLGGYSLGVRKLEVGGVFNLVRGDVRGAQIAGVLNAVGGDVNGIQLAGVYNITAADMEGLQTAGVFNVAGKRFKGTQLAGVFNIAGKEIRGAQISGVFNIASKVHGVQIGLINIADSVKGIPIGFMSIVGKGYHKIEISADEIFYNNVAFRTGVHGFYNIFHAGAKPSSYREEKTLWTFGYGVGTAPRLSRKLFMNLDLTANQIVDGNSIEALNLLNKVYVGLEYQAFKKLSITAGATVNGLVTERYYDAYPALFTDYQPAIFLDRDFGRDHNLKMWMGAKVGLRFL